MHDFLINYILPQFSPLVRTEKSAGNCDLSKIRADPSRLDFFPSRHHTYFVTLLPKEELALK